MPRFDLIKYCLVSSAGLLAITSGGPAAACSDLPNICAAQERHNQSMAEIAATSPQGTADPRYEEPPADPTGERTNMAAAMAAMMGATGGDSAELAELKKDPLYARYENGGWDFYQDKEDALPGEYCAAFYWKKSGLVRLSGPGTDYEGALLTFWSDDIPKPDSVRKLKVTLNQSDGSPPQTVEAINYKLRGEPYGAIALTVPSLDALLDNMLDVHGFDLFVSGKSVAKVDWTGGFAARDRLKSCAAKRARK